MLSPREKLKKLQEMKNPSLHANNLILDKIQMMKGETGDTGPAGKTPQKGVDYLTETEINSFISHVKLFITPGEKGDKGDLGPAGKNGETPTRGVDYWTNKDQDKILKDVLSQIPRPKDGISPDVNDLVRKVADEIKKEPIQFKDIKGTEQLVAFLKSGGFRGGGGGASILLETNGTHNGSQSILNLIAGSNITLTDNGTGGVTIASSGGGSTSTGINGLNGTTNIGLGGTITSDTTVDLATGHTFQLGSSGTFLTLSNAFSNNVTGLTNVNQAGTSSATVGMDEASMFIGIQTAGGESGFQWGNGGAMNYEDDNGLSGFSYFADYSANGIAFWGDRWIPDAGWVNAQIAATPSVNIYNSNGTLTAGRTMLLGGHSLSINDSTTAASTSIGILAPGEFGFVTYDSGATNSPGATMAIFSTSGNQEAIIGIAHNSGDGHQSTLQFTNTAAAVFTDTIFSTGMKYAADYSANYTSRSIPDVAYVLAHGGGSGTVTSVATDTTLTGGPITTTGTLGINLTNANTWTGAQTVSTAPLTISGNQSQAAWTTKGIQLSVLAASLTNTSSSGTVALTAANSFGIPTLLASSATTYTNSTTLYIAGAPVSSTNVTQTNAYSLYVAGGTSIFLGQTIFQPTTALSSGNFTGVGIYPTINETSTATSHSLDIYPFLQSTGGVNLLIAAGTAASAGGGSPSTVFTMSTNGQTALGSGITRAGMFNLGGNLSASAWGTTGINLNVVGSGYTDTSSATGTTTNNMVNTFGIPTLAASNTGVIYTNAATVYIAGAPTAGTNVTITNDYALYSAAGTNFFATGFGSSAGARIGVGGVAGGAQVILNGGATTGAAFGTTGFGAISVNAATFSSTTSTGTIAISGITTFGIPTLTATNATTLTKSATVYIAGAPVASTNITQTTAMALYVAGGTVQFDGAFAVGNGLTTLQGIVVGTSTGGNDFNTAGPGNSTTINPSTAAMFQWAGSTTVELRTYLGGTNATSATGTNYSNFMVGSAPIQTFTSGTHAWFNSATILPIGTITISGSATVTNTATLYVGGPATGGTNNYSLYVAGTIYQNARYSKFGNSAPNNTNLSAGASPGIELWGNDNTTGGVEIGSGNVSSGTSAYTGYFLNNDLASDGLVDHFGFIGLNSSGYTDTTFGSAFAIANLMYIQNTDGPLSLFASKASAQYINFLIGGTATSNEIARFTSTGLQFTTGTITKYNAINTTGLGVPAIYGYARPTAGKTAATTLSTYTVGATDGSFLVSANILVTAVVTASFTVTCTYTDESNTSRTLTLNFSQVNGTLIQTITSVLGVGAYEGVPLHIRCKASTSITIATVGTFTSVTYNGEGMITQIA